MTRPALVMIHGLMGSLAYFRPETHVKNAEVHTPSLLGYGELSGADPHELTLELQAEHLSRYIASNTRGDVWILAHSIGGAVATVLIDLYPERIQALINHEGNFTLKDAFWTSTIAKKDPHEWSREFREMRADPKAWLARNHFATTPENLAWASDMLGNQSPAIVQAMSKVIVAETGDPAYLAAVRRLVDRKLPIHLMAGARSAASWDVPDFVRQSSRSFTVIPEAGHLTMLEAPGPFWQAVDRILAAACGQSS